MITPQSLGGLTLVLVVVLLVWAGGCPGPKLGDVSLAADAGPDQTVAAGETVFLTGTASPGDNSSALSYRWQQTEGSPAVTLEQINTPVASFVAPETAATLVFELTVNDSTGHSITDSAVVTVTPAAAPESILYVANYTSAGVTAYDIATPDILNGNAVPRAHLLGTGTLLAGPTDLVIDNNGGLLVSNLTGKSLTGYADALNPQSINGNAAPTRVVTGPATGLSCPVCMAISTGNDLLFVAEYTLPTIHVYANASANTFTGDVAPARDLESADIDQARGLHLGADDELYVANLGNNTVAVFAGASSLNGNVSADRTIQSPAFAGVFDVYVDAHDTLYVLNNSIGGNKINIFTDASSRSGTVAPDATLTVAGASNIVAIAVDSAGDAYVTDSNDPCAIYGYDKIAARSGAIRPDRTLTGSKALLASPLRVFLHE